MNKTTLRNKLSEDRLPRKKIEQMLGEITLLEKEAEEQARIARDSDPFWFYKPSTGELSEEARKFLEKHLKPEDIPQRLGGQLDVHLSLATTIGASGGNQCLGAETEIFDPVKGKKFRVSDIKSDFHVLAWDGSKIVAAKALQPFTKQVDEIYEIGLSNGEKFTASLGHKVLTASGFARLEELPPGSFVFHPLSISDAYRKVHGADDLNFFEIVQGSRCDCLSCCRFYDERLRSEEGSVLDASPLPVGALEHMALAFSHRDDLVYKLSGNRSYQSRSRLSNQDEAHRYEGRASDILSHASYKPYKPVSDYGQEHFQSRHASSRQQSMTGFSPQANQFGVFSSLVVTSVTYKRMDVKWDFMVPGYHNYIHNGIVSRNSGKTTVGCIEAFIKTTGQVPYSLRGLYPEEKIPKKFPQFVRVVGEDYINGVLRNLIPTYRKWVPRDYLLFGSWEKSFSAEQSTLSIGHKGELLGTIEFMSNKQDLGSFQGPTRHKMIYDEEPREDIRKENLLRFTTASRMDELFCMTPTKGMTWVYRDLFSRWQNGDPSVEWFKLPSVGNKMANLNILEDLIKGLEYNEMKMRLLGEFISLSGLIYGRLFDKKIHVIEPFNLDPTEWVVFRGIDPHTAKPSVCVEVAVNAEGQYVVCGAYKRADDTQDFKDALAARARERKYRLGWSRCDKSANTTNKLLQNQNIYRLLSEGENAIPALFLSEKFTGSIHAGVEEIKRLLKVNPISGKPSLMIFNLPELKGLVNDFLSLERDAYENEDERGIKDRIAEGRHDEHAALRYIFQGMPYWFPPETELSPVEPVSDMTGY